MSSDLQGVSPLTQPNVNPDKKIYEIVVDPDRAHLGESFVINLNKPEEEEGAGRAMVNDGQKSTIIEHLMRQSGSAKKLSSVPKKVGSAIPDISGINHAHPANPVPVAAVEPPKVKVFFDMPGLGSIAFRYHKVIVLNEQIVFMTDKRFGGNAEFYPYCNVKSGEEKKPVGVYVEGDNRLFLLDPTVQGFPIRFDCDPYEFCLVPLGGSKALNSAMMEEVGIVNSSDKGKTNGEESGNRDRYYAEESEPGRDPHGDYESLEGGLGGVL